MEDARHKGTSRYNQPIATTGSKVVNEKSGWTTERIIAIMGAFFGGVAMCISAWNNSKLDSVQGVQEQAVQKADEVKGELATRSAQTDAKLGRIEQTSEKTAQTSEKTAATMKDTIEPQLFLTWKRLESLAEEVDTAENIAAAAAAKKAYQDYMKKKNGKP